MTTTQKKCLSCQYEAHWKQTGEFESVQAERHWTMWGCTCDPEAEAEAEAYIEIVSR